MSPSSVSAGTCTATELSQSCPVADEQLRPTLSLLSVHSLNDIPFVCESSSLAGSDQLEFSYPFYQGEDSPCAASTSSNSLPISPIPEQSPSRNDADNAPDALSSLAELENSLPGPIASPAVCESVEQVLELKTRVHNLASVLSESSGRTLSAVILSSVLDRLLCSYSHVVQMSSALAPSTNSLHQQMSQYYLLRDINTQLQIVEPSVHLFDNVSKLSDFIKWDQRQMVNSFLTLLRTAPDFIATAYLNLSSSDAAKIVGPDPETAENVLSAQRQSPLSILFHGLFRNSSCRVDYFAHLIVAVSSESHQKAARATFHQDHSFSNVPHLIAAIFDYFANAQPVLSDECKLKMDRLLRKLLKQGRAHADHTTIAASDAQYQELLSEVALELAVVLQTPGFCGKDFPALAATAAYFSESPSYIQELAIESYYRRIKRVLCSPSSFGLLKDTYTGNECCTGLLDALADTLLRDHLQPFERKSNLRDAIVGCHHRVRNPPVFHEEGELMVLSLYDIVCIFRTLFPSRQMDTVTELDDWDSTDTDSNEWCLSNIRGDLEPVMKDLARHMPYHTAYFPREQYKGIFSEDWQVFRLQGNGLVEDADKSAWSFDDDSNDPLEAAITTNLPLEIQLEAELLAARQRGDYLAEFALHTALGADRSPSVSILIATYERLHARYTRLANLYRDIRTHQDLSGHGISDAKKSLASLVKDLDLQRMHLWYAVEVRQGLAWQRSHDVVNALSGGEILMRIKSGASSSSVRGLVPRPRRLSLLSNHSVTENFYVSRDYLTNPKLVDREVETTRCFMRQNHVHNFCISEEPIHRFLCEMDALSKKILNSENLSASICYKKEAQPKPNNTKTGHRTSTSALLEPRAAPQESTAHQQRRSFSSLFDLFERKITADNSVSAKSSLGLDCPVINKNESPCVNDVQGLILSDLGHDFIERGTEVDSFMQRTGRMLLEGDSTPYLPALNSISEQSSPLAKFYGFEMLGKLAMARNSAAMRSNSTPEAELTLELRKVFCREPSTLFCDLQIVSSLVPSSLLDNTPAGKIFWEVAEAACCVLDEVISKSLDLALRIERYHTETGAAGAVVANMSISDTAYIWSFCARCGNAFAQKHLALLYSQYPQTSLDVMPFSHPSVLFDGVDSTNARSAVVAHWKQQVSQKRGSRFRGHCLRNLG